LHTHKALNYRLSGLDIAIKIHDCEKGAGFSGTVLEISVPG